MPSYVYILANKKNGTLYIGITSDLIKRIYEHKNKTFKGFTAKYGVDKLVYYETFGDIELAIQREKQMKKWNRAWKAKYIYDTNPEWEDLYDRIVG